jgi:acyl carrier protein
MSFNGRLLDMDERIYELMSKLLGVSKGDLNMDSSMETLSGWDSLKHMEIIASIEEAWEITLLPDDIISMISVAKIKEVLEKQ